MKFSDKYVCAQLQQILFSLAAVKLR